jgi:hypothetical protein
MEKAVGAPPRRGFPFICALNEDAVVDNQAGAAAAIAMICLRVIRKFSLNCGMSNS